MRSVAAILAVVTAALASCAPDYAHTAFRCDAERPCPADQTCYAGRCRRGLPTGDGVVCGAATCDASHQCCVDSVNAPRCIAASDVCPGTAALCDGSEDCRPGDRCCADGNTVFCDASCGNYACRDAADCPSTEPNCCAGDDTPWGTCSDAGC